MLFSDEQPRLASFGSVMSLVPHRRHAVPRVMDLLGSAAAAAGPSLMDLALSEARRAVIDAASSYVSSAPSTDVGDRRSQRDTRRVGVVRRREGDGGGGGPPKKAKTEPRDPDEAIERGTTMHSSSMSTSRRITGTRMTRFHALNCVEFKQFEGTPSVSNISSDTPVVDQLFDGMTVSSSSSARVGRQVFLSSVRFHGLLKKTAEIYSVGDDIPHYALGLVVLSRTHNNAASAPALVDLYDNAVTQTMGFALFRNTNNMKRLSVLRMKMFKFVPKPVLALAATTAPTGAELDQAEQQIAWSFTVKFPRALKVSFATTSTSSALSDIEDNCLLVYFLQEAAGGVTYNWTRRWRLRYTD